MRAKRRVPRHQRAVVLTYPATIDENPNITTTSETMMENEETWRYDKRPGQAIAREENPLLGSPAGSAAAIDAHHGELPTTGIVRWLSLLCATLSIVAGVAVWKALHPAAVPTTMEAAATSFVPQHDLWYPQVPSSDFGNYKEYSVIHTDRSLNLMSKPFREVMYDLNQLLKTTYNAEQVAIIPGYVKRRRPPPA